MRMPLNVDCTARVKRLVHVAGAWLVAAALVWPISDALAQSGGTWNSVGPPGGTVLSLLRSPRSPSLLYAGTAENGVFMTGDAGQTWSAANAGLPATDRSASRSVRALASDGQYVYAATDAGLFYAAAGAAASDLPSWSPLNTLPSMSGISLLAFDASTGSLFAAATGASAGAVPVVYRMTVPALGVAPVGDWSSAPLPPGTEGTGLGALAVVPDGGAGSGLLASAANRLYVASVVGGASALSWLDADPLGTFAATGAIEALHYSTEFLRAYACSAGQFFAASDPLNPSQNAWLVAPVSPPLASDATCAAITSGGLAAGGPAVLAAATSAGVYVSSDGTTFSATTALAISPAANAVALAGGDAPALYVGAGFGVASQALATLGPAGTWSTNNGSPNVAAGGSNGRLNNANVADSAVIGTTWFAAIAAPQYGDVLMSSDAGATWVSTGLGAVAGAQVDIAALEADPTHRVVYAGTGSGLYALSASAGTWVQVSGANIAGVNTLARGAAALYIGTDTGAFALPTGATPSGATAVSSGLDALRVSALHVADGKVYAGTYDFNTSLASVSVATDPAGGVPVWNDFATGPVGSNRITGLALAGTSLLAATRGGLVKVAAPGGAWNSANTGASSASWVSDPNGVATSLFSDGTMVYAATGSNGVFASPIGASLTFTWTALSGAGDFGLPSLGVRRLRADGNTLFASTSAGVATLDGIAGVAPPPPGPAPAPDSGGGGGAADAGSLVGLALLACVLAVTRRARRQRT